MYTAAQSFMQQTPSGIQTAEYNKIFVNSVLVEFLHSGYGIFIKEEVIKSQFSPKTKPL